jgi:hypothetical protein
MVRQGDGGLNKRNCAKMYIFGSTYVGLVRNSQLLLMAAVFATPRGSLTRN